MMDDAAVDGNLAGHGGGDHRSSIARRDMDGVSGREEMRKAKPGATSGWERFLGEGACWRGLRWGLT